MSTTDYLYGLEGAEWLEIDPDDVLEQLWDQADPPLEAGLVVEVVQWEALPAEKFMPDADRLLDRYRDIVYDNAGHDAVDAIGWEHPDLRSAAENFVTEMNRRIRWMLPGRVVEVHRYELTDAENCRWDRLLDKAVAS